MEKDDTAMWGFRNWLWRDRHTEGGGREQWNQGGGGWRVRHQVGGDRAGKGEGAQEAEEGQRQETDPRERQSGPAPEDNAS